MFGYDRPVDNAKIVELFEELADLSDLAGENPHAVRAYRNFAETVHGLTEPLQDIWKRGEAQSLPGVGKATAAKLDELFTTGSFQALDRVRSEVPRSLLELLRIPGLGPKRARAVWQGLGITSLAELEYACRENRLVTLPGFGAKTQARLLASIAFVLESKNAIVLGRALEIADDVEKLLRDKGASQVRVAGEARRGRPQVAKLVLVATGISLDEAKQALEGSGRITEIESTGAEGLRLLYEGKSPFELRVVPSNRFASTLFFETADEAHLDALAERARSRGKDLHALVEASASEDAIYEALDLAPIPPELREGSGLEQPTQLIERKDLAGIFHSHTDWSDGTATIESMAKATAGAGFGFLGISDHSKAAAYARGLDSERLAQQAEAIAEARTRVPGVALLHGIEVDILRDGSLDLDDETLARLDFVIASVHSSMTLSAEEMTARLVRAVSHPLVTMLGHPTGRLLLGRQGYAFDFEAVVRAAVANDTFLEINASRYRLDLDDTLVRRAAALGARFSINPDAHSPSGIGDSDLGVLVARRAGLRPEQVLNARPADEVFTWLKERKDKAITRLGGLA